MQFSVILSLGVGLNSFMTKLHESTVSKIGLIQPLKFRTWETKLFKMTRFETLHFQMGTKVTFASGLGLNVFNLVLKSTQNSELSNLQATLDVA